MVGPPVIEENREIHKVDLSVSIEVCGTGKLHISCADIETHGLAVAALCLSTGAKLLEHSLDRMKRLVCKVSCRECGAP